MDNEQFVSNLANYDWTFDGADTQYLTHGIHKYPARMIPQIPNSIIKAAEYAGLEKGSRILDPFCGSGTTLVEAALNNHSSVGFDINPFACELSRAKTTPITEQEAVTKAFQELSGKYPRIQAITESDARFVTEEETDVNSGWFPQPQFAQLVALEEEISSIESSYGEAVGRAFRVALSSIVREVSYQRNGEFKRYRMPEEKRETHNPNVVELFDDAACEVLLAIKDFTSMVDESVSTVVHQSDSREMSELDDNSIDGVITSPPYGDHSTTVAYGQFSRDASILAHNETKDSMLDVDKTGLGGKYEYESTGEIEAYSPALERTIDALEDVDGRSDDALDFFEDYFAVMKQVGRVVKPNQPIIWVVSNRTMSRQLIPTHLITRELCEHLGYTHLTTEPRSIPTKTLPWENAPENVEGEKGDLMADENILVMAAPDTITK